jgi:hypothetical protein
MDSAVRVGVETLATMRDHLGKGAPGPDLSGLASRPIVVRFGGTPIIGGPTLIQTFGCNSCTVGDRDHLRTGAESNICISGPGPRGPLVRSGAAIISAEFWSCLYDHTFGLVNAGSTPSTGVYLTKNWCVAANCRVPSTVNFRLT